MDTNDPNYDEHHEGDTYGLDHVPNCNLECRFYENEFPAENECVMGEVHRVDQLTGAYVALLEYNKIEALIMSSEFTRKRVKSVHRLMKVGKKEVLLVTKVDESRGFIDLSRKRVKAEDVKACEERYNTSLKAHNILRQTAALLEEDLLSLYQRVGWPLSKKFESIYDAFMLSLSDPDTVFKSIEIDDKTIEILQQNISKRMKPQTIKIYADFEISCYTFEGVDAVKRALKKAQEELGECKDMEITIRLIKSPLYEVSTHVLQSRTVVSKKVEGSESKSSEVKQVYTSNVQLGINKINQLLELIEKNITECKGKFKAIHKTTAIGAKEEEDIENMIKNLTKEQDDDTSSKNGEEDNEEGMNIDLEEYDESESTAKTNDNADEEDKKVDSDDEDL